MLGNLSLWETARQCHQLLAGAEIPHAIMRGVAVCLHGYQRNTVDLDLLVRREDSPAIHAALGQGGYVWQAESAEFRSISGIPVQFLLAGDRAGSDTAVVLPDPANLASVTAIEGLPVLSLALLIESKIACGVGNPRRTHRDLADVVELILINRLTASFARFLHKSLRPTFRTLVKSSRGEL